METDSCPRILVVDDEIHPRTVLVEMARALGYHASEAVTGEQALQQIRFGNFDLLITDMQMPGMDGVQLLGTARIVAPNVSVVMVTAHGTIESAVQAMKKGAEDYLLKPVELATFELMLERIFKKRELVRQNLRLRSENDALRRELQVRYHVPSLIGRSDKSRALLKRTEDCIKKRNSVLIKGETGTGRADLARMIHYNSPWGQNSLILFDCASTPKEFHEMQLFGEEAKSEAGTKVNTRPGMVERAHLGTLVISNLQLLEPRCQARLAVVISEERTQRTGGTRFYHVQVRVITTAEPTRLKEAKEKNLIRSDLMGLLEQEVIEVPPLRERLEDIPLLVAACAKRAAVSLGKSIDKIDKAVTQALTAYEFAGNVGEMNAMVEAAVIRCQDSELRLEHFPLLKPSL